MAEHAPLKIRFDSFDLDQANARLSRNGEPVPLPPKAFDVLCALARTPGVLVSKDALLDAAWGHRYVSESVLKTTISQLRDALGDSAKQPRFIETISKRGYRFLATVAGAQAAPAAPVAAPAIELHIVGRGPALAALNDCWQRAASGKRQIAWLVGEAGIGKTTLIEGLESALAEPALANAPLAIRGQCVEQHGAGEPYLPVLEALAELCRKDASASALMRNVAPSWVLQLPWLLSDAERAGLEQLVAFGNQNRMLRELGEFFDQFTARRPLLLITEDLHWSDQATVRLIDHLARRRSPSRLMWLASFRPTEIVARDHPLKGLRQELRLHRLCTEILLEPFSEADLADYLRDRFPEAKLAAGFVRGLHQHTDGLPLFVTALIDDLLAQDKFDPTRAPSHAGAWQLPENLAGIMEDQIARLPAQSVAVLEAASVCGMEFRVETVAAALEESSDRLGLWCDELMPAQIWIRPLDVQHHDDGRLLVRYTFHHALYRHVVYRRIAALRRTQLHRRVARAMEASRADGVKVTAAELATQYEAGQDWLPALRHFAQAADGALRQFAPQDALTLTEHAVQLISRSPESNERNELEVELLGVRSIAVSQLHGTTSDEATATFERLDTLAEKLTGKTRRAYEMELGWVWQARGEYARAQDFAARKLALAKSRDDALLAISACNLMGATLFFQGKLAQARDTLMHGLARFSEFGADVAGVSFVMDPFASIHARLSQVLWHLGDLDQAMEHSRISLSRAEALKQPYGIIYARMQAGLLATRREDIDGALAHAEVLRAVVDEHSVVEGEAYALWLRGWALASRGETAGIDMILEGYEQHVRQRRLGGGCAAVLGSAADALRRAKRLSDARQKIDAAMTLASSVGERAYLPFLRLLDSRIAAEEGAADRAREAAETALTESRAQGTRWYELASLVALAEMDPAERKHAASLEACMTHFEAAAPTPLFERARSLALGARGGVTRG